MSAHTIGRDLKDLAEFHAIGDPGSAGTFDLQPGTSGGNAACVSGGTAEERYTPVALNHVVGTRFTVTNNSATSLVIKDAAAGNTLATLDDGNEAVEFMLSNDNGTKLWLSSMLFDATAAT